jgi:hypothetical protein
MSLPVAITSSGMDSLAVLGQNLEIARKFRPTEADEMDALRERCRAFATDGRYERFKTTKFYEVILVASSTGIQRRKNYLSEVGLPQVSVIFSITIAFLPKWLTR